MKNTTNDSTKDQKANIKLVLPNLIEEHSKQHHFYGRALTHSVSIVKRKVFLFYNSSDDVLS